MKVLALLRGAGTARPQPPRRSILLIPLLAGLAWAGPGGAAEPATGAPGLADLVQVADLTGLAASPDGNLVAFRVERARLDSNDYPSDWYVSDLTTGEVRQIGPGGQAIYRDPGLAETETPVWSRDGRYLYYRALIDGIVHVWRANTQGGGARPILQPGADVRRMRLSEDGGALLIEVGASRDEIRFAERQEYDSGILVDQTVDLAQNVFRGGIVNGRNATQRLTGTWFTRDGLLWQTPVRVLRADLVTLAVTQASDPPAPSAEMPIFTQGEVFTQTLVSGSGDVARLEYNWRRRESRLTVTRRQDNMTAATCEADLCRDASISWAAWQPGRDAIVFLTRARDTNSLFVWDIASNEVRGVAQFEGSLGGGRDPQAPCAVAAMAAICVAAAPGAPPFVRRIDLASGEAGTLFDPNPRLRATTLQPERMSWSGAQGTRFTGWLFMPPGASGRAPLFINYYDCDGYLRGGLGDEWPLEALARAGIAALCINKSGFDASTGENATSNYRIALEGIEAVIRLLDTRGVIDPARVGMGGLSFGTGATLWTAINSNLLAAASISSPTLESAYYWLHGVRGRDNHEILRRYWQLGAPDETPERWRTLSPAANVDRIRAPLLMQMPEHESRNSIELHARLTNSTTPVELYVFPDEPHIKFMPRHKLAAYERNLDWFRFWLQGYSDPDPLKAAQYQRWAALAERRDAASR